jgi:hypothetical protein
MVYSWDDKEAECYKLYMEERRNLEEVMSYWEMRGFTPRCVNCATAVYGLPYTRALFHMAMNVTGKPSAL